MKKFLLMLCFLLALSPAVPSSIYLFEQFDDTFLPNGWSVVGTDISFWSISETNKAGGTPNEITFYCNTPQTWRLISPSVDLTGVERLTFSFKLRYEKWGTDMNIGIATSSDNGGHWHEGWVQNFGATGNHEISQEIVTEDMGKPNVKFCIFFTNTQGANYSDAYIDDIAAFVQRDLDIELSAITTEAVQVSRSFDVGVRLFNTGSTTITSLEGYYQFGDMPPVSQTFNVNIPANTNANLSFDEPADLIPDTYMLTMGIVKVNGTEDDDLTNNTLTQKTSIACATTQRLPMFEHFTSSSCGTCPQLSQQMETFCNSNPGKYTYVKYQMNWPPPGDPYYTSECGIRKTYYGVISLPTLFMDAVDCELNPVTQSDFDNHYDTPSAVEIEGAYSVEGNTIHITADLMAFADLDEVRVYVAVSEKTTHNNATINGETSFHHVMMKMLPNAQGTTLSLRAGEIHHLSFDHDMSSTHVEEMDDLEVAVWIQNYDTKKVFNSHFLFETPNHPFAPEQLTLTKEGNTLTAQWNAPAGNAPTGYNIWMNETLVAENSNETSHTFSIAPGEDFHCVQVQAVYGDGITSVKAVATDNSTLSVEEQDFGSLGLYPNPASGTIYIQGFMPNKIMMYNALGQLVKAFGKVQQIPVDDLPNGLYHLVATDEKGTIRNTKVIINH